MRLPGSEARIARSAGVVISTSPRLSRRTHKIRWASVQRGALVLVALVLGVIFTGVATPVEAAGIGTFGALVVAGLHRRLTWRAL